MRRTPIQADEILAASKPIAHPTLGVGHERHVLRAIAPRNRDVREPNAAIVTPNTFEYKLQTSSDAHIGNLALRAPGDKPASESVRMPANRNDPGLLANALAALR